MVRSSREAPDGAEKAPIETAVVDHPRVPGVGVGKDRFGPVRLAHPLEVRGDGVEGLVPGDPLEPALALFSDALEGVEDPIG